MHTKFWSENLKRRFSRGKPKGRREDNIRMDLREIMWESVVWMHLPQDRDQLHTVVNTVMNLWIL
jgi:hypothetical protein